MDRKDQLINMWKQCIVTNTQLAKYCISIALQNRRRYEAVEKATRVPWFVIAAIHMRESSFNFNCNLANGEPLNQKTKLVPKGQGPWSSWEESAIWALEYDNLTKVERWDLPTMLDVLERYNGLGYARKSLPSPYLWSGTNNYTSGKFKEIWTPFGYKPYYSSSTVDKQLGCAALIKEICNLKYVNIEVPNNNIV